MITDYCLASKQHRSHFLIHHLLATESVCQAVTLEGIDQRCIVLNVMAAFDNQLIEGKKSACKSPIISIE